MRRQESARLEMRPRRGRRPLEYSRGARPSAVPRLRPLRLIGGWADHKGRVDRVGLSYLIPAIAVGAGATAVMDLWNLFLKHALGIPSLDYCLLGRWICHMRDGTLRHVSIAAAASKPFECILGRIAHYTIGVVLGAMFLALVRGDWLARPKVLPPLIFGIITVAFPFFIMQPALGLGVASSKVRNPVQARLKSLMSHAAFGVGLYVCARAVRAL